MTDARVFFFIKSTCRYCLPLSIELLSVSDEDVTRIKSSYNSGAFLTSYYF